MCTCVRVCECVCVCVCVCVRVSESVYTYSTCVEGERTERFINCLMASIHKFGGGGGGMRY